VTPRYYRSESEWLWPMISENNSVKILWNPWSTEIGIGKREWCISDTTNVVISVMITICVVFGLYVLPGHCIRIYFPYVVIYIYLCYSISHQYIFVCGWLAYCSTRISIIWLVITNDGSQSPDWMRRYASLIYSSLPMPSLLLNTNQVTFTAHTSLMIMVRH